ncbi:MAG: hypothetical protein ACT4NV_04770 [Rhodoferax sp.]
MKKMVLAFAGLMAVTSVIGGELFTGWTNEPKMYQVGEPLEMGAMIGGYPVWNGEGKWRVVEVKKTSTTGTGTAMGELSAFQTEGGKFVASLWTYANLAQSNSGDWTDEPCKREDYLFKASLGGVFRDVNCVSINHIVKYPGNPGGKQADLYAMLKAEGVDTPPTVLRVIWTRYSSGSRKLVHSLTINPELAGFSRESEAEWGRNSWHKAQVANDPAKKKFIEDLSAWALTFAKQMEPAFRQQKDAFQSIPSWRVVYDPSGKVTEEKVSASN